MEVYSSWYSTVYSTYLIRELNVFGVIAFLESPLFFGGNKIGSSLRQLLLSKGGSIELEDVRLV